MKRTEKISKADKGKHVTSDIKKAQRRAERRVLKRELAGEEPQRLLRRRYFGWST